MRYRRTVWPIALIAVGVALLLGCIPIPGSYRRMRGDGTRPEEQIGDDRSTKPLKFMHAKSQDVIRVLGDPSGRTQNGRGFVYSYLINDVTTIFPICFMAYPSASPRFLEVEFDESDTLIRYKVYTREEAEKAGIPTPAPKYKHRYTEVFESPEESD